ncbi:MAG: YlmC/YmxH family sporulation protein [Firmicutes bacterium]|nr:YlmC/YmxH family sporulation protein [Bacillota bacterium]MCL2771304.1 YlmC/YmxH family sporulation protein [Bacillota bacterium]
MNEITLTELRKKEVVNIFDGKILGVICDIVFEQCSGKILGFVVPGNRRLFSLLKSNTDIFVPYHCILKVGADIILIEIKYDSNHNLKR